MILLDQVYGRYPQGDLGVYVEHFEAKAATIYGVLGPNGAGKSTFLYLLSGFLGPTSGRRVIDESIALMPSKNGLFSASVADNLAYPLRFLKKPYEERLREVASRLQLDHLLDKQVRNLSSGEYQRVLLARTFMVDKGLYLLDEPTANVDPELVFSMETFIRQEQERTGATIVLVSHHLAQLKRLCHELLFFDQQQLKGTGSMEELSRDSSQNRFRQFVRVETGEEYGPI